MSSFIECVPPKIHFCGTIRPLLYFLFATTDSSNSTVNPGPPICLSSWVSFTQVEQIVRKNWYLFWYHFSLINLLFLNEIIIFSSMTLVVEYQFWLPGLKHIWNQSPLPIYDLRKFYDFPKFYKIDAPLPKSW